MLKRFLGNVFKRVFGKKNCIDHAVTKLQNETNIKTTTTVQTAEFIIFYQNLFITQEVFRNVAWGVILLLFYYLILLSINTQFCIVTFS